MFFVILLLYFIFALISFIDSKKYDVELEAQKLYGENLVSVLSRFRKTSDYLKILSEKAANLKHEFTDVRVRILTYHESKMKNEIKELLGLNTVPTTEQPTSPVFRSRSKKAARRQEVQEIDKETQTKIDRIDDYKEYRSFLTVKERNEFKDLGFKYISEAIHSIIEKMGVDGADVCRRQEHSYVSRRTVAGASSYEKTQRSSNGVD